MTKKGDKLRNSVWFLQMLLDLKPNPDPDPTKLLPLQTSTDGKEKRRKTEIWNVKLFTPFQLFLPLDNILI